MDNDPLIGSVLNNSYRIDKLLADGGMSRIYSAEQLSLSRRVVVKMLLPGYNDEEFIDLFLREARVYSQINHPNVVAVIDFGRSDSGLVFLVMEYLDGMTLTEVLEHKGPLKLANIVWLMEQICAGIHAAHKLNIVHRDLKPSNIMVARMAGDVSVAKVLDFGISKPLAEKDLQNTTLGMVMGTPGYLAPEQIEGRRDIDIRADIYALGALLFFMITGRRPFSGGNRDLIMSKQLTSLPPPLTSVDGIDPDCLRLQGVIDGAMAIDRDQRYASVKVLWQHLLTLSQPPQPGAAADATVVQKPGHYQVVVSGRCEPFADPEKAKQQLCESLGLSPAQADTFFTGQAIVFRQHLPEAEARRFENLFRKIGVVSQVEYMDAEGASAGQGMASLLPAASQAEPLTLPQADTLPTQVSSSLTTDVGVSGITGLLASIRHPSQPHASPRKAWPGTLIAVSALVIMIAIGGVAFQLLKPETPLEQALRDFNASIVNQQLDDMVIQANRVLTLNEQAPSSKTPPDIMAQIAPQVVAHAFRLDEREGALVAFDWLSNQVDRNRFLVASSEELASLYETLRVDAWMARWLQEGQANFQALEKFVNDNPAPHVPVRMARDLHQYLPVERRAWLYRLALQRGYPAEPTIFTDLTDALSRVTPTSGDLPAYQLLLDFYPAQTRDWARQLAADASALSILNAGQVFAKLDDARLQDPYFQALHELSKGYSSPEHAATALTFFSGINDPTQRTQVLALHDWIVEPKTKVTRWKYRGLTHARANRDALQAQWLP